MNNNNQSKRIKCVLCRVCIPAYMREKHNKFKPHVKRLETFSGRKVYKTINEDDCNKNFAKFMAKNREHKAYEKDSMKDFLCKICNKVIIGEERIQHSMIVHNSVNYKDIYEERINSLFIDICCQEYNKICK